MPRLRLSIRSPPAGSHASGRTLLTRGSDFAHPLRPALCYTPLHPICLVADPPEVLAPCPIFAPFAAL